MRWLLSGVLGVLAVVLIQVGFVLIGAFFLSRHDPMFAVVVDFIQGRGSHPVTLSAGVAVILVALAVFVWSSGTGRESAHFNFNTDLGGVGISLPALEQFITRQAKALPMVESVKPRVTTSADGKRLRLSLETSVIATGSIKNITETVQEAVVSAIREGLGLTEVETVDVDVTKISMPKGGLAPAAAAEAPHPGPPPLLGKPETAASRAATPAGTDDADETDHPLP